MHLVRVDAEPVAQQLLVADLGALTLGRAAIWEGLLQRLCSWQGRYSGCAKSCRSGVRFRSNVKSEGVMKSFTISAIVLVGVLDASSGVSAALITNGSFETPIVPIGNFTDFAVGSSGVTGWNVFGPAGANVAIVNGIFSQNGVTFQAEDGNQWLDLTGDGSNSTEGVSQAVTTTIGDQYQLSYFVGNTTGGGGVFGTTSTVGVLLNGALAFTDTNSNVSPTNLNWEQFTHTFVATGTSTTLGFRNADPSNDNSNGLDNIVLNDLGPVTPVPEPASLGLLAAGLATFAVIRRRWRSGVCSIG
jgi:hypothetical protein